MDESAKDLSCARCGSSISLTANFCSQCGQSVVDRTPPRDPQAKWYYNVLFVLFLLFFVLGPFALPLVWKNNRFSPTLKWILTLATIAYTIAIALLCFWALRAVLAAFGDLSASIQPWY